MFGVNYDRKSRKWQATIEYQGVRHWLGSYDTPREAAAARINGGRARFSGVMESFEVSK